MMMTDATLVPFLRSVPAPVDFGDGTYSARGKRREVTEADVVYLLQTSAEFVSVAVLILYSRARRSTSTASNWQPPSTRCSQR
jgi:hypothetical protein